jgi:hypothetical protein
VRAVIAGILEVFVLRDGGLTESDFDHHSGEQLGPAYDSPDADLAFDAAREDAAFGGTKGRD